MFIRCVNGRAYVAESVRVGGRHVQRHLGPALPEWVELIKADWTLREAACQERRRQREEDRQEDQKLSEQCLAARRAFESTMTLAGYHNPNWRGWKKRRVSKSDRQRSERGADV